MTKYQQFRDGVIKHPKNPAVRMKFANYYYTMARRNYATAEYEKAVHNLGMAIRIYAKTMSLTTDGTQTAANHQRDAKKDLLKAQGALKAQKEAAASHIEELEGVYIDEEDEGEDEGDEDDGDSDLEG